MEILSKFVKFLKKLSKSLTIIDLLVLTYAVQLLVNFYYIIVCP